jgi:hypothetical protein
MRKRALGFLLAVAAITASAASPSGTAGACAASLPAASAGLPWPVTLQTNCGRFTVDTDGRVAVQPGASLPVPAGAAWSPIDGRWWKVIRRHLLVGRWHDLLWRSHGTFRSVSEVGGLVFAPDRVAFSYGYGPHEKLYVAPLDGAEHLVAAGEAPLAFTATGRLLTLGARGGRIYARRTDASGRRALADHVSTLATAPDGTLFFLERNRLMSTKGSRPAFLASVSELGLTGTSVLEALGPLVALRDRHRLVVLRADGSTFASSQLPRRKKRTDGVSSAVTTDAETDAVAFTATNGNTALGSSGVETTYLLRSGDTAALPIHNERIDFAVCERMAELEWHQHWLLYSASEGNVAAVDTEGVSPTVDLSAFARSLPGTADDDSEGGLDIEASWAVRAEVSVGS